MNQILRRLFQDEEGQDIAEYAVMLAVILVIVVYRPADRIAGEHRLLSSRQCIQ